MISDVEKSVGVSLLGLFFVFLVSVSGVGILSRTFSVVLTSHQGPSMACVGSSRYL